MAFRDKRGHLWISPNEMRERFGHSDNFVPHIRQIKYVMSKLPVPFFVEWWHVWDVSTQIHWLQAWIVYTIPYDDQEEK
jgi:hypothetical protein